MIGVLSFVNLFVTFLSSCFAIGETSAVRGWAGATNELGICCVRVRFPAAPPLSTFET